MRGHRTLAITATAPPKGYAMNDEKKLSDDELKDIAGGVSKQPSKKESNRTDDGSGKGTLDGGASLSPDEKTK